MSQHVLPLALSRLNWLPHVDLVCTSLAALLWLIWPQWGPWVLALALAPWLLRWWQTSRLTVRTPFDVPLVLFMLTAMVGLWAAYNPTAAQAKFWLLVASMFFFYTLANQPATQLWFVAKLLSLLNVLIAIYFLLTHDWQAVPTYMGLLDSIAKGWMEIRPFLEMSPLHPNQVAGFIVVLLPLALAVGRHGWHDWSLVGQAIASAAMLIILFALLLTGSRGAWLALAAALSVWGWSAISQQLARILHRPQPHVFGFGLGLGALMGTAIVLLFPGNLLSLANRLPGAATADSRAAIFGNTLHLLGDFPFTGGGLDAFPGLYSQYILVIPQRIFNYAHNLYLDVALEQGVAGLLALAVMLLGALWLLGQKQDEPKTDESYVWLRWAVITGLLVMIGRGFVDDAFYGNRGTPLLWVLPGLAVALSRATTNQSFLSRLSMAQWGVVALVLLVPIGLNFLRPQGRAAWVANLGAVQMARVELANWPTNEWDDGRALPALYPAEQLFMRALEIYPANRTAHHRLGMVAMLRQDFETAVGHLEAAYQTDSTHTGIRKSLAYSYLWVGQFDRAQMLLSELAEARDELKVYAWWWRNQGRDDLAGQAESMFSLLDAAKALDQQ